MATEGEPTEATETPTEAEQTPVEGAELTPVDGGEAAPPGDEPVAAAGEGEEGAEGEGKPAKEEKPKTPAEIFASLTEAEQQAIARKHANGTMAAARRAEARVEAVKAENAAVKTELGTYKEFTQQLASGDPAALARIGFSSVREFIDRVIAFGGEKPAPTAEERVAALEKERQEERAATARARVEETKAAVFKALEGKPDKYAWTLTKQGRAEVWQGIESYYAEHGVCPDVAVWAIADAIEAEMEADNAPVAQKKFTGQRQPANNGTDPGTARPGSLNPGKTLTSKGSSGAPVVKELSLDPDERRRQVSEELRAAGIL
jgi:hypothetical protein